MRATVTRCFTRDAGQIRDFPIRVKRCLIKSGGGGGMESEGSETVVASERASDAGRTGRSRERPLCAAETPARRLVCTDDRNLNVM